MPVLDRLASLDLLPWPWATGFGCVLGVVIGSYLATIYVRWPQGLSADHGRSRCDGCGRQLRWFELVPLLSWLVVRGRCRSCHATIAPAHIAIEATCGIAGALAFGTGLPLVAPVIWLLVALAFFDAAYLWLPDRLILPLSIACILAPALPEATPLLRALGGAIGFGALWLLAFVYRRRTGTVGLGGGDAKLFGAIGLWFGALQLPLIMLLACAIGFGDVGVRLLRGEDSRQLRLPLGTYLSIAAIGLALVNGWNAING